MFLEEYKNNINTTKSGNLLILLTIILYNKQNRGMCFINRETGTDSNRFPGCIIHTYDCTQNVISIQFLCHIVYNIKICN